MDDISTNLSRGFEALRAGRAREAAGFCQRVLAADPKRVEGHFLVGLVATDMQDWRTAVRGFGSVTKLDPSHAAGWSQLARALLRLGLMVQANEAVASAAKAGSADPHVQDLIGATYAMLGDLGAARGWYERAYDAIPDSKLFAVNYATALVYLGDVLEAERVLQDSLGRDEANPQALWLLSSLRSAQDRTRADALFARAEAAGDGAGTAFLSYAAGKEYEDCEEWDAAFGAFEHGARAKRATLNYDEREEDELFGVLTATFTRAWAKRAAPGHDATAPIFVIGQPRTGTTLIERIMTSHSQVRSAGELQQFGIAVRRFAQASGAPDFPAGIAQTGATIDLAKLADTYLQTAAPMIPDTPHFVDKLPANFLYLPLIAKALPNAKIVHVTRGAMDSCFASYKQLFAEAYYHSYDQGEMARHYVRYRRLMDHWRGILGDRIFDISYEETVADLEPNARRLIGFLGLDWEEACLTFHERAGAVATASAVQVREKPHTRSVGRWRRYDDQLGVMQEVLRASGLLE